MPSNLINEDNDELTIKETRALERKASEDLSYYLYDHEKDIAIGINDFGDLKDVFRRCAGRDAIWVNPKTKAVVK